MPQHMFLLLFLFLLMLSLVWLWHLSSSHHCPPHSRTVALRTRSNVSSSHAPHEIVQLVASPPLSKSVVEPALPPVRPWREVKSRRGAPKRVNTQGFACPNRKCPYSGITNADIHALVGDGTHGHAEQIQTFRCQACRTTFTARRHTPLYRLKTPSHQIAVVLTALAEELDSSAAERIFGYQQTTIAT
jgi:transposase-like protein